MPDINEIPVTNNATIPANVNYVTFDLEMGGVSRTSDISNLWASRI